MAIRSYTELQASRAIDEMKNGYVPLKPILKILYELSEVQKVYGLKETFEVLYGGTIEDYEEGENYE